MGTPITPVYEFINYHRPSDLTQVDKRQLVASHIGSHFRNRSRAAQRKRLLSGRWDQNSTRSTVHILQNCQTGGSHLGRQPDVARRVTEDYRILQIGRSNAHVLDHFQQTTLSEVQGFFNLIFSYPYCTRSSPIARAVVLTVLEDVTCLFPFFLYVSIIMKVLGVGRLPSAPIEFYNARPLSLLSCEFSRESPQRNTCLQAMIWLSAAFWLRSMPDVVRTHLRGIKALLGCSGLDEQPVEWVEVIVFYDLFTTFGNLERPIFPFIPRKVCPRLSTNNRNTRLLRLLGNSVLDQINEACRCLTQEFLKCTYSWTDK